MEREFAVSNATDVVLSGLEQLNNCNLLLSAFEVSRVPMPHAAAISRRALVAGGSLIVPAIISMLAPTPGAAKSGDTSSNGQGNGNGNNGNGNGNNGNNGNGNGNNGNGNGNGKGNS